MIRSIIGIQRQRRETQLLKLKSQINMEEKKDELEKQFKRKFDAHCAKYNKHIAKEDEYRESARQLRVLYKEWFDVALELGDPIPVWL
jgi:hypothetical protein